MRPASSKAGASRALRVFPRCDPLAGEERPHHRVRPARHVRDAAQRALEGLTRSLGKEARNAVTTNLIQVDPGADIDATLRFFLSPRSAYVSSQVVRIDGIATNASDDWSKPLAGKRALVTGTARVIGVSIAAVLAEHGAIVTGLDVEAARDALDQTMLAIEVASPSNCAHAALVASGGVDIIVHNAGITRDKTIARMIKDMWDSVIDINLIAQECIDEAPLAQNVLRAGGRTSSRGVVDQRHRGQSRTDHYATSKAGVIGRVLSMAPMLKSRDITINAVAPSFIETHMTSRMPFGVREAGRRLNSMGQGGQPFDVAETVAWLASPGSASVTGNIVRVCEQSLIGA